MKGQKLFEMLSYCYIRSFKKTPKESKEAVRGNTFTFLLRKDVNYFFMLMN